MHQQLAHVGIALAHPLFQLAHAAVAFGVVATRYSVTQQLGMDLEKCQRLGDGVVHLARQHAPLFGHGRFALQRTRAQTLDGAGKLARHGLQQIAQLVGQCNWRPKEQIDLPQRALLHLHWNADQCLEPGIAAVGQGQLGGRCDRNNTRARTRLRLATQACAGMQAVLGTGHGTRKSVGGQQHIPFVGFVRPTHSRRVGARHAADLLHEALGQGLQVGRGCRQRTDLIQRRQPLILIGHARRFFSHLVLQLVVRDLQRVRHQVEPGSKLAELVVRIHWQSGAQLALAQAGLGLLQPGQRVDNQPVADRHERHGGHDGNSHHDELKQVQRRRPARNLDLDGIYKAVNLLHKGIGLGQGLHPVGWHGAIPLSARLRPLRADAVESCARRIAPRHKQRPRRVARAQQRKAGVELARTLLQRAGRFSL